MYILKINKLIAHVRLLFQFERSLKKVTFITRIYISGRVLHIDFRRMDSTWQVVGKKQSNVSTEQIKTTNKKNSVKNGVKKPASSDSIVRSLIFTDAKSNFAKKSTPKREKVEQPKNVYADDSKLISTKLASTPKQPASPKSSPVILDQGSSQYKLAKSIPETGTCLEVPDGPVQVFENNQKSVNHKCIHFLLSKLLVTYTCMDIFDMNYRWGELSVYRSSDLKLLSTLHLPPKTGNHLHWVDFHPTHPYIALVFSIKINKKTPFSFIFQVEKHEQQKFTSLHNIILFDYVKNQSIIVAERNLSAFFYCDSENPDECFTKNFRNLIFPANFKPMIKKQEQPEIKNNTDGSIFFISQSEKKRLVKSGKKTCG